MGPDQHAQLDRFSLFLPFPYRVAVILVAGCPRAHPISCPSLFVPATPPRLDIPPSYSLDSPPSALTTYILGRDPWLY